MTIEPTITINGEELSTAQVTTVRVALEAFVFELRRDGLGNDQQSKARTNDHLVRIAEVKRLIFGQKFV